MISFKDHFASAVQSFVASFLVVLGTTLATGTIEWSWAFWGAILLACVRGAIKEVFARFAPVALGGKQV